MIESNMREWIHVLPERLSFPNTVTWHVSSRQINEKRETIITKYIGEALAVMKDIKSSKQMRQTLAMIRILAQSKRSIEDARSRPLRRAVKELRKELAKART